MVFSSSSNWGRYLVVEKYSTIDSIDVQIVVDALSPNFDSVSYSLADAGGYLAWDCHLQSGC